MPADARSLTESTPMCTESNVVVSLICVGMLLNELEQFTESASAALLGLERGVFASCAHEAAQLLRIAAGVSCGPAGHGVVARDEFGAPAFRLVQRKRILRAP